MAEGEIGENKRRLVSRREFLMGSGAVIAAAALASCSNKTTVTTTGTTTNPTVPTPAAAAVTTQVATTQVAPPIVPKSLALGHVEMFQSATGMDGLNGIKTIVELDNKNGGIDIGGEKYQVQLVEYDVGSTQNTTTAAINRLVFQDKVKYILDGGGTAPMAEPPITEPNKVMMFTMAVSIPAWSPQWNYVYDGDASSATVAIPMGWLCKNYSDAVKHLLIAYPDSKLGNLLLMMLTMTFQAFGVTPKSVSYPASSQDMSALGTKVAVENPAIFTTMSGDTTLDALVFNAARSAGYKGQFYAAVPQSVEAMAGLYSQEAMEGMINPAIDTEFDPPSTQIAKDFKDAWITKYGKWTAPNVGTVAQYFCLKTALKQAGSLDVDKVAAVLNNGMKYDSVVGPCQMVNRPDLGITNSVNSIATSYIKTIKNAKPVKIATIEIDEGLGYLRATQKGPPPGPPPG